MEEVLFETPKGDRILDVCENCQFIWIDQEEWGDLPRKAKAAPEKTLKDFNISDALREKVAVQRIEELREIHNLEPSEQESPEKVWQWIPALAGLPIEEDQPTHSRFAFATWSTFFLILIASLYAFAHPNSFQESGLIPAEWSRGGGITLISSFFLHAGIFHLIINLYFLITFGDNVEHLLGPARFVILLLLATLCGDITHILINPESTVPCIGASGGISGVIAFYGLSFPHARISLLVRRSRWFGIFQENSFLQVGAIWLFGIWILMQFFYAYLQFHGSTNISGAGHLGGAIAGVILWWVFPKEMTPRNAQSPLESLRRKKHR